MLGANRKLFSQQRVVDNYKFTSMLCLSAWVEQVYNTHIVSTYLNREIIVHCHRVLSKFAFRYLVRILFTVSLDKFHSDCNITRHLKTQHCSMYTSKRKWLKQCDTHLFVYCPDPGKQTSMWLLEETHSFNHFKFISSHTRYSDMLYGARWCCIACGVKFWSKTV